MSFVMMLLRGQACRWGDRVTCEGRELLVSRKKTELAGGVSSLCVNGSVDMLGRHE